MFIVHNEHCLSLKNSFFMFPFHDIRLRSISTTLCPRSTTSCSLCLMYVIHFKNSEFGIHHFIFHLHFYMLYSPVTTSCRLSIAQYSLSAILCFLSQCVSFIFTSQCSFYSTQSCFSISSAYTRKNSISTSPLK